jgi:hypothetical protein
VEDFVLQMNNPSIDYLHPAYVSATTAYWWGSRNAIGISIDDSATITGKKGNLDNSKHIRRIWGLKK